VAPIALAVPIQAPQAVPTVAAPSATPSNTIIFTLVYTVNNTDIMRLTNGMVVNVTNFAQASFNIRADAPSTTLIQSIRFLPSSQSETSKPWAYCGNVGDLYNACADFAVEGTVTVVARPYTGRFLTGSVLPDVSVTFSLVGKPNPPAVTRFPIFINCGGPTFTDAQNRVWTKDTYFSGGGTYSNYSVDIVNSVDDTIYQSERYGNFIYQIPVPLGSYSVILHFAEI
jgi:Malectin domain